MKQALVIRGAEVDGRAVDVRIEDGRIVNVASPSERTAAPRPGDDAFDAHGGALLPGLHDHHIHLLSLAAAARSVRVGPADVAGAAGLAGALEAADAALEPGRWIRAVGYHESVAGPLDRHALDAIVPDRSVRVQHRSGALWVLNSAAIRAVGVDSPSGQLYGLDGWLAARVPHEPLNLAAIGRALLECGVTGVTDATPTDRSEDLELLAGAVAEGALPQEVVVMGGPGLDPKAGEELERGPVKLLVADHRLPEVDGLVAAIEDAHRAGRAVAVHCVTRVGLLLALAAWDEAGAIAGDRVEHGAVVHPEEAARIAAHGLTVVTQPAFVAERGDAYLADVDPEDRPYLWRCAGLLEAGIAVAGSTDAPFGPADPWQAIAAATTRRTPAGEVLGGEERVDARRALALFLGPPGRPGGAARRVTPGAAADLCLLAAPLEEALQAPSASLVVATIRRGHLTTPNRDR